MAGSSSRSSASKISTKPHNLDCSKEFSFDQINFTKVTPNKRGPRCKHSYKRQEFTFIASHQITKLQNAISNSKTHSWDFNLKFDSESQQNPGGAIKKVMVYLHQSFKRNKREFKKLPIKISEIGYAPFQITIVFKLCSKIMRINDDDCYKEPITKYQKHLEQTFSYELTFPQGASAQLHSWSRFLVPFYTNNPKIMKEIKIHQSFKSYTNWSTNTCSPTTTTTTNQISKDQLMIELIRLKNQTKMPVKIKNQKYIKKPTRSFSLRTNISQDSSGFTSSYHTRYASQPIVPELKDEKSSHYNYYCKRNIMCDPTITMQKDYHHSVAASSTIHLSTSYPTYPTTSVSRAPSLQSSSLVANNNYGSSSVAEAYSNRTTQNNAAILVDISPVYSQKSSMLYHTVGKQDNNTIDLSNSQRSSMLPMHLLANIQPTNNFDSLNDHFIDAPSITHFPQPTNNYYIQLDHSNSDCKMLYNNNNNSTQNNLLEFISLSPPKFDCSYIEDDTNMPDHYDNFVPLLDNNASVGHSSILTSHTTHALPHQYDHDHDHDQEGSSNSQSKILRQIQNLELLCNNNLNTYNRANEFDDNKLTPNTSSYNQLYVMLSQNNINNHPSHGHSLSLPNILPVQKDNINYMNNDQSYDLYNNNNTPINNNFSESNPTSINQMNFEASPYLIPPENISTINTYQNNMDKFRDEFYVSMPGIIDQLLPPPPPLIDCSIQNSINTLLLNYQNDSSQILNNITQITTSNQNLYHPIETPFNNTITITNTNNNNNNNYNNKEPSNYTNRNSNTNPNPTPNPKTGRL